MARNRVGPMSGKQPDYLSYLLRLWRVNHAQETIWRASLKSASTGEQMGFASLDELFEFLRQQTRTMFSADRDRREKQE